MLDLQEAEASAKKAETSRKREEDIAAGLVQMNGRELFKHEPWVFDNDLYWSRSLESAFTVGFYINMLYLYTEVGEIS